MTRDARVWIHSGEERWVLLTAEIVSNRTTSTGRCYFTLSCSGLIDAHLVHSWRSRNFDIEILSSRGGPPDRVEGSIVIVRFGDVEVLSEYIEGLWRRGNYGDPDDLILYYFDLVSSYDIPEETL